MENKVYICAAIILIICFLGVIFYTYFEIYPTKERIYPSKEANNNKYLAAERWMKETGYNVKVIKNINKINIAEAAEKVVIIDFWFFGENEIKEIIEWVKSGHYLVVLDDFLIEDPEISEFFKEQGLIMEEKFINQIRLIEIKIGEGAITAADMPYFMQNENISEIKNAELTWMLTGARTDSNNRGILFIRHSIWNTSKSFFGAIMERGNLTPVIISALLLILIGFWTVIPGFGLVIHDKQRNSRPIKDRFTAEIRFLKKYKALDYYLDKKENGYSYRELINQYRRKLNGNAEN